MRILPSILMAAVLMAGGTASAMASDVEIILKNKSFGTNITRRSTTCIGAVCSFPYSVSHGPYGNTETITANLNTGSSSALIIFEYGTYSKRCRATLSLLTNNGAATSFLFTPSWQRSAGLPDCDIDVSHDITNGKATWEINMYPH